MVFALCDAVDVGGSIALDTVLSTSRQSYIEAEASNELGMQVQCLLFALLFIRVIKLTTFAACGIGLHPTSP
jgi:hypothetical protein